MQKIVQMIAFWTLLVIAIWIKASLAYDYVYKYITR
jgi:hypothetical protein